MIKRIVMLAVGSLALVACGPGAKIDGKNGAAQALFAASKPTQASSENSNTPIDLTGGISWNCPEGGTAEIKGAGISLGTGGVSTALTLRYNGCGLAKSDVGVALFNGDMTFSQNVSTSTTTLGVDQSFKGRVTVTGAYDDFLEADVKQTIAVGDLGASNGAGVSMVLKGTLTTSEGTFTFDESVNVVAGSISAKINAQR